LLQHDTGQAPLTLSRAELLGDLERNPQTQFLIIGGGIHGAACARLAARNGYSCVLAERGDYAGETSSRSSKMLHGGLRYLELLDFAQVAEGIRAREDLFRTAPHLCLPEPFLIPLPHGDRWFRWKLALGLTLYDQMGAPPERRHRFLSREDVAKTGYRFGASALDGAFLYTDGLTDDARLTLESVLQARQYGARCLNYLEVMNIRRVGGRIAVLCRDRLDGVEIEISAERVINCAGPWAACLLPGGSEPPTGEVRFSAGAHLLFDRPWSGPSLFLPMPGKSRYYFVWPHPGGTLVGTTEREVSTAAFDPLPTAGEIEEVLARLASDLPHAELDRTSLYYAFSGIRTLPVRGQGKGTARLSRRHRWIASEGVWTLLGGKLTTANLTAWEGFRLAIRGMETTRPLKSLEGAPYPGAGDPEALCSTRDALVREGLDESRAALLVRRLGVRARFLLADPCRLEPLTPQLMRGEVELALREEQAVTLEDILRRRTGIEYLPGALLPALAAVTPLLAALRGSPDVGEEARTYQERWIHLQKVLEGAEVSTPTDE
jgi:glycerol-3-phosphate dehydrogenase